MAPSPPAPPQRRLPPPESVARTTRRFAVEPVETTTKSNRSHSKKGTTTLCASSARRFAQQLEESSAKDTRKGPPHGRVPLISSTVIQSSLSIVPAATADLATTKKPSRFAPQLIETTSRSRKRGDVIPALLQTDKTDLSPGDQVYLPRHLRFSQPSSLPIAPEEFHHRSSEEVSLLSDSRYSSINLSRSAPRRTSFKAPHLEPIRSLPDSEESNDSTCPSLSTSPTVSVSERGLSKHVSRVRESCDDRFSGYLLALAARAAEKQLKERAMAAYPNENFHEPVDHFAVDRESDSSEEESGVGLLVREAEEDKRLFRQESAAGWELSDLRRHRELLEQQKQRQVVTVHSDSRWRMRTTEIPQDPAIARAHKGTSDLDQHSHSTSAKESNQKGTDLTRMRNAASPPILGHDLQFQRCRSPQQTRIDPTQHPCFRREEEIKSRQHTGLWTPNSALSRQGSSGGLWHGVCAASDPNVPSPLKVMRTGLMTPRVDRDDALSKLLEEGKHLLPTTPTVPGENEAMRIDDILSVEQSIEVEVYDGFITQIYNYLSLGYPSLARKYDDELSKISKIPLDEIRENDQGVDTKGFVGVPEGCGTDESEIRDGACGRWRALRLYIKEWARQQSGMIFPTEDANITWGVRARKGSWAV